MCCQRYFRTRTPNRAVPFDALFLWQRYSLYKTILVSKRAFRFQHTLSMRAFSLCTWRRWEAVSCVWWEQLEWSDLKPLLRWLHHCCQPVFTKESQTLSQKSQKKPDSRFEAYAHKTCTTTHKVDIKTGQKHRYNTSPIFRSIFFPCIYTVVHLFLSITYIIFRATVKFLHYSVHPAW